MILVVEESQGSDVKSSINFCGVVGWALEVGRWWGSK